MGDMKTGPSVLDAAVPAHTPGPWKIEAPYLSEVQTEQNETVASCWYRDAEGVDIQVRGVVGCSLEESAANARLIAAAPDLLEAGKRALRGDGYEYTLPDSVRSVLRAAIAEAEGRA